MYYQESNTVTTTISAKIPDELREKARLHHIKISQVVRRAIESEVKKIESKNLSHDLDGMGRMLRKNVSCNEISSAVRSSRNER